MVAQKNNIATSGVAIIEATSLINIRVGMQSEFRVLKRKEHDWLYTLGIEGYAW